MRDIVAACRHGIAVVAVVSFGLFAATGSAKAQIGSDRYSSIVEDASNGAVLLGVSPDELRHPASLTKMMTLYLTFEALRDGRLSLNTPLVASVESASMPPSRIGLRPGMTITVDDAILALVTKSANDVAATLGEALGGGSESQFAQMMTLKARSLGMTRTLFRNASGLPDDEQVTTARDMALLGRRLMADFPDRYAYFSTPSFTWHGRTIFNHNGLLNQYEGADGIKTGYVNDSGFNLVTSALRDGVRLIGVVFGGATTRERDRHMMALLDEGFDRMGVAPRRSGPTFLASAHAATLSHRAAPFALPVAFRQARAESRAESRAEMLAAARAERMAALASRRGTRHARAFARIEQGDNEGPAAPVRGRALARGGRAEMVLVNTHVSRARPAAPATPMLRRVSTPVPAAHAHRGRTRG